MVFKIIFTLLVLSSMFASNVSATRSLTIDTDSLSSRLQGNGSAGYWDCWNALMEIRSCSNEIVSFFLNGKADLGESCCKSISIITHNCWPNMLSSLGFTAAEGNVLSGFCDKGNVPFVAPAAFPAQSVDVVDSDLVITATSPIASRSLVEVKPASTMLARLKLDDETSSNSCWDSLFTLQSCTGEVILFFLSGETTYLGKSCCQAIRIIEHDCWPSMLTSLGYTDEEGFVLRGYCNGVLRVDL
ncbi:hypothetical protein QQ045_020732 [Rhodiola kirilowii]